MTSTNALLTRARFETAIRSAPAAHVTPALRERVHILAFGLAAGFVIAAAMLQALPNDIPSSASAPIDVAAASLTGNAVLAVDTTLRSAPQHSVAPQGHASRGELLYLLGRSVDGNWLLVRVAGRTRSTGWVPVKEVETAVNLWELPALAMPDPQMPAPWGDVDSTSDEATRA
jgi:hypothetical protein